MTSIIKETTDETFESDVIKSELPVFVDFWAEWCGPCKMLLPVLEQAAADYEGRINFFKLNVDKNPNTAAQFGVRSIPYLVLFNKGEAVANLLGTKTKTELCTFLEEHIS